MPRRGGEDVVQPLLADRLRARLGGVPHRDHDGVGAAPVQQVGDVVREGVVAAVVGRPGLPVVDPDGGAPVARAEVQLDARPSQPDGTVKTRLYQSLSFCVMRRWMPDSADSATNGTRICSGKAAGRGVRRGHGEVPDAVEVRPVGAGELRARILGQRVVDRDLVGPRGGHRRGFRRSRRRAAVAAPGMVRAVPPGGPAPPGRSPSTAVSGGRGGRVRVFYASSLLGKVGVGDVRVRGRVREERDRPPYRTRRREPGGPPPRPGSTSVAVGGPATSGRRPPRRGRRR